MANISEPVAPKNIGSELFSTSRRVGAGMGANVFLVRKIVEVKGGSAALCKRVRLPHVTSQTHIAVVTSLKRITQLTTTEKVPFFLE